MSEWVIPFEELEITWSPLGSGRFGKVYRQVHDHHFNSPCYICITSVAKVRRRRNYISRDKSSYVVPSRRMKDCNELMAHVNFINYIECCNLCHKSFVNVQL